MLSLFPRDVLDEIWDLTESVPEGFSSYSYLYSICGIVLKLEQLTLHCSVKHLHLHCSVKQEQSDLGLY